MNGDPYFLLAKNVALSFNLLYTKNGEKNAGSFFSNEVCMIF